jgi:uncharacterized protein (DUF111 family)
MTYQSKMETITIKIEHSTIHTRITETRSGAIISDTYEYYENEEVAFEKLYQLQEVMDLVYKKEP